MTKEEKEELKEYIKQVIADDINEVFEIRGIVKLALDNLLLTKERYGELARRLDRLEQKLQQTQNGFDHEYHDLSQL